MALSNVGTAAYALGYTPNPRCTDDLGTPLNGRYIVERHEAARGRDTTLASYGWSTLERCVALTVGVL